MRHLGSYGVALCAALGVACTSSSAPSVSLPQPASQPPPPRASRWRVALGPAGSHARSSASGERASIARVGGVLVLSAPEGSRHVLDPETGRVVRALDVAASHVAGAHLLDWDARGRVSARDPRTLEALWSVDLAALIAGSDDVASIPREDLAVATKHYLERLALDVGARRVFVQHIDHAQARGAGYSVVTLNAVERASGRLVWQEQARVAPFGGPLEHRVGEREVVWPQRVEGDAGGLRVEVRELDTGRLRCAARLDAGRLVAVEGRLALVSDHRASSLLALDDCAVRRLEGHGRALEGGDVLAVDPGGAWLRRVDGRSGATRWEIAWGALEEGAAPDGAAQATEQPRLFMDAAQGLLTRLDWATGALLDRVFVGAERQPLVTTGARGAAVLWWPDGAVEAVDVLASARDVTVRGRVAVEPDGVPLERLRVACAEARLDRLGGSRSAGRAPKMEVVRVGPQGDFACTVRARYVVDVRVLANAADAEAIHGALAQAGARGPCLKLDEGVAASVVVSPSQRDRPPVQLNVKASLDGYYCGDAEGLCPPEDCYWKPTPAY